MKKLISLINCPIRICFSVGFCCKPTLSNHPILNKVIVTELRRACFHIDVIPTSIHSLLTTFIQYVFHSFNRLLYAHVLLFNLLDLTPILHQFKFKLAKPIDTIKFGWSNQFEWIKVPWFKHGNTVECKREHWLRTNKSLSDCFQWNSA